MSENEESSSKFSIQCSISQYMNKIWQIEYKYGKRVENPKDEMSNKS